MKNWLISIIFSIQIFLSFYLFKECHLVLDDVDRIMQMANDEFSSNYDYFTFKKWCKMRRK